MLSQVNYRVPNMRFLRERLTVRAGGPSAGGWEAGCPRPCGRPDRKCRSASQDLEQRTSDITYGQFAQLYRSLMYSAQKTVHEPPTPTAPTLLSHPSPACLSPAALLGGDWVPFLQFFSS